MRRALAALILILPLLGGLAWPAPVELPAEVRVRPGRLLRLEAKGDSKVVKWVNVHDDLDAIPSETGKWLILAGPTPGKYRLAAYGAAADGGPSDPVYVLVIVEGPPPPPVPPVPPVPPTPPPSPAPIPAAGFRVLVVYESSELARMPPAQLNILYAAAVRTYLNSSCVVGADGHTRDWRMWDKDADTAGESPLWRDAMRRPRAAVPWVIVSNGVTGFEGPLPGTVDEFLALVKKYGG